MSDEKNDHDFRDTVRWVFSIIGTFIGIVFLGLAVIVGLVFGFCALAR